MSLQFIMGPSGAGKSHYLYDWVTKESMNHPEKNYVVLVPEQFTMQTQKDLVMANPRKGILNVEVLSFNRLAHRVMEEVGAAEKVILNDVGKNFVIRKVAGDKERELKVLRGKLKKVGYITEMKSVISELTQYDIRPENMDVMLGKLENNPSLYHKLNDIKLIYEGFREYLSDRYITGEEVLDVLVPMVSQSKLLKNSIIVLDGFTGFTPIQNKLLRELLQVCEEVVITVTMDERENPYAYKNLYQLFALSKQMVVNLMKIAKEVRVSVKDPVYLYQTPVYRFKDNEMLGFLEKHLFRYSKECYNGSQDAVQIWCAKNPKEEVDFVAQSIRRLVRTEGYRYKDIVVLASDVNIYANQIGRIFKQYDLPVFMDHKRSILLNSFVEYIRSLLAMAEQNFTYKSVFRYLRAGFSNLTAKETDLLENYVIAMGIRGYKKWQEKWVRRTKGMDEGQLSEINRTREIFLSDIEDVVAVLKKRSKTVLEVTKALHTFFVKNELQKRVREYQLQFEVSGELELEKEYAQIYRIIIELLEQFVELLGDEKISLKEYCELLDAGLEEAKVGIIPPSVDQIVVGDVERSRIKDVKVVFLIGVNDSFIPGKSQKSGLLSEYDRECISTDGNVLAPNAKEKAYIQKYYLYLALTKPSHQVFLTYSKTSSEGEAERPAYLIFELKKMFAGLSIREVPRELKEKELTKESGISGLVSGFQEKQEGFSGEWQELYSWYKKHPEWALKMDSLVEAAFYQSEEKNISEEIANNLFRDVLLQGGATKMEQFSKCAYAHFLKYGLRLEEREEYQFQPSDWGNLIHDAIERYSKKLRNAGLSWEQVSEDKQEQFILECIDESISNYGNSILYSSARNEYTISRMKRILRRTVWALTKQLEHGDFVPSGYEVAIEGQGVIDRVDTCETEDKVYVKIIDYKTGKESFNWVKLYYGIQMQLALYMNAIVEQKQKEFPDKEIVPAGMFYYRVDDPIVEKPEEGDSVEEAILKGLHPDGILQGSEDVVCHYDKDFDESSLVIPVTKNKNGSFRKSEKMLSKEDFETISEFTKMRVEDIKRQIMEGTISINPYALERATGCDYCPYHAICGFDDRMEGQEYRKFDKLKGPKVLEKMYEEVEAWKIDLQPNNDK